MNTRNPKEDDNPPAFAHAEAIIKEPNDPRVEWGAVVMTIDQLFALNGLS